MRTYEFQAANLFAAKTQRTVSRWLFTLPQTRYVEDVSQDKQFQAQDIDFIWTCKEGSYTVELKADRHDSPNFFIETVSNTNKGTSGCFLYTAADLLFYFFTKTRVLFSLPVIQTRHWFIQNLKRFPQRSTSTSIDGYRGYQTIGHLVPIKAALREVPGIETYTLTSSIK